MVLEEVVLMVLMVFGHVLLLCDQLSDFVLVEKEMMLFDVDDVQVSQTAMTLFLIIEYKNSFCR